MGIFVVATLLLFGAGVFWIGNSQFRFTSTYRLYADFENVAGLTEGASVQVGGVHEGTVRRILLPPRPDQKVRVEMDLKGITRSVVKKDSVAAIQTEGLVGDQYVAITFGSTGAPPVNNGDTIGAETPLQISDIIKKTNDLLGAAQGTMQNLNDISTKLNRGQGSAGALLNDRALYRNVNEAAQNLQEDTEALKHNFLTRGFFKNRGYEDRSELKENSIARLPAGQPSNRFTWSAGKLFDKPDSAKLKNSKMLDEGGRYLQSNPFGLAVVAAYADMKGDTDKQRELTEARASVAREYLVQHFKLDDTRIKTMAFGKSENTPDGGSVALLVYPASKSGAGGR